MEPVSETVFFSPPATRQLHKTKNSIKGTQMLKYINRGGFSNFTTILIIPRLSLVGIFV